MPGGVQPSSVGLARVNADQTGVVPRTAYSGSPTYNQEPTKATSVVLVVPRQLSPFDKHVDSKVEYTLVKTSIN